MSLAVLTDEQIAGLLDALTLEEAEGFLEALRNALHEYSAGTQTVAEDDVQQPPRTSVTLTATGATTLFMPSCSSAGVGMKVITLSPSQTTQAADESTIRPTGAITLFSQTGQPLGILHASTLTAFRTALASMCLLMRRETVREITVFGCGAQAYWHVRLALLFRGSTIRHVNVVSRRFSESSRRMMSRFYNMPQHIKEREGWPEAKISVLTPGYGEYARLLTSHLRNADVIFCCTPSTEPLFDASILTSHEGRRKGRLIVAIGSFMHSMHELPPELLRQATRPSERPHHHYHKHATEGGVVVVDTLDGAMKEAGEIIDAGLTPQQLVELGELVMLSKIALDEDENDSNNTSLDNVSTPSILSVPSSSLEKLSLSTHTSAMASVYGRRSSRELAGSGSPGSPASPSSPTKHRSPSPTSSRHSRSRSRSRPFYHRSLSQASADQKRKKEDHMALWLQRGNVIYKSVGLGLMDLTVGMHLIEFARKKDVGAYIAGF